jgi:periplasmic protein TonB
MPTRRSTFCIRIPELLRWAAAFVIAMTLHATLAWFALLNDFDRNDSGEPPPAVYIDLSTLVAVAKPEPADLTQGPLMTEAASMPARDPQSETVVSARESPVPPEPEKPPSPEVQNATPLSRTEARTDQIPPVPVDETVQAELTPPPPPKPDHEAPEPPQEARTKSPVEPSQEKARQTTAPPMYEAQQATLSVAPAVGEASNPSNAISTWKSEMAARLNRFKRYPGRSNNLGTALVAFTINRAGQVLDAQLIDSSGDRNLDAEALALPLHASPFPPPPPGLGGETISLRFPIRFKK